MAFRATLNNSMAGPRPWGHCANLSLAAFLKAYHVGHGLLPQNTALGQGPSFLPQTAQGNRSSNDNRVFIDQTPCVRRWPQVFPSQQALEAGLVVLIPLDG